MVSVDSSKAHQALSDAERDLGSLLSDKDNTDADAAEIFDVHGFGAEGEWKKLDGTCIEKDTGECVQYFLFSSFLTWVL